MNMTVNDIKMRVRVGAEEPWLYSRGSLHFRKTAVKIIVFFYFIKTA